MKNLISNIGDLPIPHLAQRFGTPAFIYERAVIEKRIAELKVFEVIRVFGLNGFMPRSRYFLRLSGPVLK